MLRVLRRLFPIAFVVFILIQLVPSGQSNPPVMPSQTIEQTLTVPPQVKAILERSCRNCHSNETVWPWYAKIAPVSWFLAGDVNSARDDMNLSEWGVANPDAQRDTLLELCRQVRKGAMPLSAYTWLHREAVLTPADVTTLCEWSEVARNELRAKEKR